MDRPTHYVIPADWWDNFGLSEVIDEYIAQGETEGTAIPVHKMPLPTLEGSRFYVEEVDGGT